jgi:ketosteroid isomerase-like protein
MPEKAPAGFITSREDIMMLRSLILSVWLVSALATPAIAEQKLKPDPEALKAAQANDAKYSEARNKKDLEGVIANYADDAVMVSPFGIIQGKEKIKDWYVGVLKATSDVVVKSEQAYTDGPITMVYGQWSAQAEVDGKTVPRHGTFADVLRDKKILIDSWNRAAESPPSAATGSTAPPTPSTNK